MKLNIQLTFTVILWTTLPVMAMDVESGEIYDTSDEIICSSGEEELAEEMGVLGLEQTFPQQANAPFLMLPFEMLVQIFKFVTGSTLEKIVFTDGDVIDSEKLINAIINKSKTINQKNFPYLFVCKQIHAIFSPTVNIIGALKTILKKHATSLKNIRDNQQRTPLHLTSLTGYVSTLKIILLAADNLSELCFATDDKDQTVLHLYLWRFSYNKRETELFLSVLLDVDNFLYIKDSQGYTVLHIAANKNNKKMIRLLLISSKNPKEYLAVKNSYERTARLEAICFSSKEAAIFLEALENALSSDDTAKYLELLDREWH